VSVRTPNYHILLADLIHPGLTPGVREATVSLRHRAYRLYAHITWHTWLRVGCVNRSAAREVRFAIADAGRRTGVQILNGAVLADHVHLLVSYRPDSRLSDFVRLAKSGGAYRANLRVPGTVKWARGFYVDSLGKSELSRVASYIARQYQRHPDRIPAEVRADKA